MRAYIDDMLVKSKSQEDHLAHLRVAFQLMGSHRLRLNPGKCAFRVRIENFYNVYCATNTFTFTIY